MVCLFNSADLYTQNSTHAAEHMEVKKKEGGTGAWTNKRGSCQQTAGEELCPGCPLPLLQHMMSHLQTAKHPQRGKKSWKKSWSWKRICHIWIIEIHLDKVAYILYFEAQRQKKLKELNITSSYKSEQIIK